MIHYFYIIFVLIIGLTFVSVPIASTVFFVVSLINYIVSRARKSCAPDKYDSHANKKKLICLIVSAVVMAVILISEYALVIAFFAELAYM